MIPLEPTDPQRVGHYQLLGKLGAGGMGSVYLARSARGRTAAVKLVQSELARQPEFRRRFEQEVDAARRIGKRWTAPVLDWDTTAQTPWVATGYVAGPSLHEVVAGSHGPLPERTLVALANGLTQSLRDIHGAGLIHRDLKPSNILLTIDGPRVIDFGIARAMEQAGEGLTRAGSAVGSPGFMSPEQCRGETVTPASDVFCLGSVLAFAATGRTPFGEADQSMHVLMLRIVQNERDLTGVPEGLLEIVESCLDPDPEQRPTLDRLLERTAEGELWDDEDADPWLPGALVAKLGKRAVELLDSEDPLYAPPKPSAAPAPARPSAPPTSYPAAVPAPPLGPPTAAPTAPPTAPPAPAQAPTPTRISSPGASPATPAPATDAASGATAGAPADRPDPTPAQAHSQAQAQAQATPGTPPPATTTSSPAQSEAAPGGPGAPGGAPHGASAMVGTPPPAGPGQTGVEAMSTMISSTPPPAGYAPAGYGTPSPPPPPPARGRRKLLWGLAAACAALLFGGVAVVVATGGDDDTSPGAKQDTVDDAPPQPEPEPDLPSHAGPPDEESEEADEESGGSPVGPGSVVPEEYLGVWTGEIHDDEGEKTGITRRLEVVPGSEGDTIATTYNIQRGLLCVGESRLVSFTALMVIDSSMTESYGGSCRAYNEQTLKLQEDGTLLWSNSSDGLTAEMRQAPTEIGDDIVPESMVGSWRPADPAQLDQQLEVRQGSAGATVLEWSISEDTAYCAWEHVLALTDPDGGSLLAGPSEVVTAEPSSACSNGDIPSVRVEEKGDELHISPLPVVDNGGWSTENDEDDETLVFVREAP